VQFRAPQAFQAAALAVGLREAGLLITLPVFLPVVRTYGWDPIWFGVIFIIIVFPQIALYFPNLVFGVAR
jgi:TRAP-type C4-dicarboxylate transport system permease large subunit